MCIRVDDAVEVAEQVERLNKEVVIGRAHLLLDQNKVADAFEHDQVSAAQCLVRIDLHVLCVVALRLSILERNVWLAHKSLITLLHCICVVCLDKAMNLGVRRMTLLAEADEIVVVFLALPQELLAFLLLNLLVEFIHLVFGHGADRITSV